MIALKEFWGRLGNRMFQYAFLRTAAQRLGVQFYCPAWEGDHIFLLNDETEKAIEPIGIDKIYTEPTYIKPGFNESALRIKDGTSIAGFFQTDKYYQDKDKVKKWFTFREEKIAFVKEKYKHIDFSKSVALVVRLGDDYAESRAYWPLSPLGYYQRGLSIVQHKKHLLIFSDEIDRARIFFKGINGRDVLFVEKCKDYEQLYLMSLCHDAIITNSTFCWWGSWLIGYKDKMVVIPKEWNRPGCSGQNHDLCSEGWISLQICRFLVDHLYVFKIWQFLKKFLKFKTRV